MDTEQSEGRAPSKSVDEAVHRICQHMLLVEKKRTNTQLKSDYANLTDIQRELLAPCKLEGISISQPPGAIKAVGDRVVMTVTTIVFHNESATTREYVTEAPLPNSNTGGNAINDTQRWGIALAYARRYALCGIFNIATGDDRDAAELTAARRNAMDDDNGLDLEDEQTWQKLFQSGAWKAFPSELDDMSNLGQLKGKELANLIRQNGQNGYSNPALVAASAALLVTLCEERRTTPDRALQDASRTGNWTGATTFFDMQGPEIAAAINFVRGLKPNGR